MDEHLTFFIDFVGFADAARSWDKEKQNILIALLHNMAALKSEFNFTEKQVEGGVQHTLQPAITTFSDHIVISYRTEHFAKLGGDNIGTVLLMAQKLIGRLAVVAMNLGLLIRGGATIGPLHHSGGVVFGEAMNEAYELESRVSIYPRIALSRKIYSEVKTNPRAIVVLDDHDGIAHLNYFTSILLEAGSSKTDRSAWLANARQIIAGNIENFERTESWNKLAKWVWFRNQLEAMCASMNKAIIE